MHKQHGASWHRCAGACCQQEGHGTSKGTLQSALVDASFDTDVRARQLAVSVDKPDPRAPHRHTPIVLVINTLLGRVVAMVEHPTVWHRVLHSADSVRVPAHATACRHAGCAFIHRVVAVDLLPTNLIICKARSTRAQWPASVGSVAQCSCYVRDATSTGLSRTQPCGLPVEDNRRLATINREPQTQVSE